MLEAEPQIIEQYIRPGKVKLVYRHLNQHGERSEQLGEASECAADQGRFWEMREALYAELYQIYGNLPAGVAAAAEAAGADAQAISACVDAGTHRAFVQADYQAAVAEGVRSRPVFKIGERTVVGAQPFSIFAQLLDAELQPS